MKIAVIADVHGNSWALEAVIQDILSRKIDSIYDLGDSLYGPLDPIGTFRLFQKYSISSLAGNDDRFILGNKAANLTHNYVVKNIEGSGALKLLGSLPPTRSIHDKLLLCHGTPFDDNSYLLEEIRSDGIIVTKNADVLEDELKDITQEIVLCAHSHCPAIVETNSKTLINVGSVGLPAYSADYPVPHRMETHNAMARYCILELDHKIRVEQIALTYDFEAAAARAEENDRPDWASWIRKGRAD